MQLFYRCRKTSILWKQLQEFFSTGLDLSDTFSWYFTQGAIFEFLYDALEHKLLLNHILLIFKTNLCKAGENKNLTFDVFKNCITKIRNSEANLKENDKYNKKWIVISDMM